MKRKRATKKWQVTYKGVSANGFSPLGKPCDTHEDAMDLIRHNAPAGDLTRFRAECVYDRSK